MLKKLMSDLAYTTGNCKQQFSPRDFSKDDLNKNVWCSLRLLQLKIEHFTKKS